MTSRCVLHTFLLLAHNNVQEKKGACPLKPDQPITCHTALVIGAGGVIGSNLIDYLTTLPEWNVIEVSRRGGQNSPRLRYISVDLLNEADTQAKLSPLTTVTHIFMLLIRIALHGPNWYNPTWQCSSMWSMPSSPSLPTSSISV